MKNLRLPLIVLAAAGTAALVMLGGRIAAQPPQGKGPGLKGGFGKAAPKAVAEPRGLRLKSPQAGPGYVLFAPLTSDTTYLINMDGQVVKTWKSDTIAAAFVYLLDNGHLIRGGSDQGQSGFFGGGAGGRIQEWDFDGKLLWDFQYNKERLLHHDISMLPNGHVLAIAWERKTAEEARAAGFRGENIPAGGIWSDMVIEFEPQRPSGARVVWEWHAWDHLVQSEEAAARPARIDINAGEPEAPQGAAPGQGTPGLELFHMNSIFYNAKFDQIMLSVPTYNEIWIIDHSTTTEQAKGSAGGKYGKGGDLLYRWGNPHTYGRGTELERFFGFEHDARWIPDGYPGAGHITVFSNRSPGPAGIQTRLFELVPPVDAQGRYPLPDKAPYGPVAPMWTYAAPDLDANFISGAQRQKNGNTFVSSGPQGHMFEINPNGQVVWDYWSPFRGTNGILAQAFPYALFRGQKIAPDEPYLTRQTLTPLQ